MRTAVLSVSVGFFIAFSQGFSLNKNNGAQYDASGHTSQHFDLLSWGASDRSHFLGHDQDGRDGPSSSDDGDVGNNEIFIMNNEATHSRRRRQVSIPMPQRSSQQQQPQAPISSGIFQGPLPAERQRHKVYEKIHVKYPYPYPPGPPSTSGPDPAIPDGAEPSGDNSSSSPAPVQEGQDQGEGQESPPAPIPVDGTDEPVGVTSIADPVTTDVPSAGSSDSVSETTTQEVQETQAVPEKIMQQEQDPESPGVPNIPDSPGQEQGQGQPGQPGQPEVSTSTTTMYPMYPMYPEEGQGQGQGQDQMQDPAQSESAPAPPQQSDTEHLNMLKRLAQSKEEIRGLQRELEQAHEQIASYEQETQSVKDQFIRSEDANLKLRGRVLQLENQNQHLQEQNGQLQQLNSEHKQQINGYKISVKELREKMDTAHSENVLLNREVTKHRRELEEILLRVRKMDEESEMCRKQVKLYQLKVNYILGRQKEQEGETKGQSQDRPQSHPPPPQIQFDDAEPQLHQDPPPPAPQEEAKEPEKTVQAQAGGSEVTDDELDPELMRMDAEIAELQRNADEVAAAIKKLALAPRQEISSPPGVIPASAIPASPVPENEQQPGGSEAVAASQVQEEVAAPENVKVEVKRENQFPGEAVQIPQRTSQQKPNVPAIPASAVVAGGDAKWEKPEGFKK